MKIPYSFELNIIDKDNDEKISDTITKKRVSIFYKGLNRNGGYITDEFAEQLLQTLPYTPIKGIYTEEDEDFEGHGERTDGRIYGVVPQDYNFKWEKHLDEDGVEREYACADVYLFTALYKEANEISGKGQSMELYGPSIKGTWTLQDGIQVFKYTNASFLGLQVLGDSVTPCFEGSAFFSLQEQKLYSLVSSILEKINTIPDKKEEIMNFSLSDRQKEDLIFKQLNKEQIDYIVMDTYTDYVIVYSLKDDCLLKFNFTRDDDNITMEETGIQVFSEYLTQEEKDCLSALLSKTEDKTYAAINQMIENKDNEINTLNTNLQNKNTDYSLLEAENQKLKDYKAKIEKDEKEKVINRYSLKLSEDVLEKYKNDIDNYSVDNLKKELAYQLVESDDSIFSKQSQQREPHVPNPEDELSGLEALLNKYKN